MRREERERVSHPGALRFKPVELVFLKVYLSFLAFITQYKIVISIMKDHIHCPM